MAEETPTITEEITETPVEIAEDTVIESALTEIIPEEVTEVVTLTPPEPEIIKRKPGRPSGSRNKAPSRPRAKKVAVEVTAPAPTPEPNVTPRYDAQHQPIPLEAKTEMAELMLRLLSQQSSERIRRKDALRRSWFN